MHAALEEMRSQVFALAGKYSHGRRREELERVFALLEQELDAGYVQSQRVMALLRAVINAQPGSTQIVNRFLRNPRVAQALQAGGSYNL
ncbi:MAG: hypothetical protein GX090_01760 [Firmicutes bacterium]|jgi:hypothetical protein|nr:hypothetical protein [Bacillota bacterium]HOB35168.1 hypothetical protein [Bacillota bacterium]HPZ90437.1 hypothetical protein [Bacillota bacterium]HQE01677.1 hypothetical protein [Bacillota bacterium]